MKFIYQVLIFSMIGLQACEDSITLDIDQTEPKIVIEGLITNENKQHYVKITQTKQFYQSGSTNRITNAIVQVSDNDNNIYNFQHNATGNNLLDGYYMADNAFLGLIGNEYTLTVTLDGETYSATDQLLPVTTIDSLTVELNVDELEDPEDEGRFYEVFFHAKEPQDRIDYYLFKFYRNGDIIKDVESDIYIAEDTFVGENIDNLPIAGFFAIDDTVKVEMYSLTREGFVYYTDMYNVLNNDGGMFGPIPANPRSNLSNGALGYFQTSAVDEMTITVKDPE